MVEAEQYGEALPTLELIFLSNGVEVAKSKNSAVWLSAMAALSGATPVVGTGHVSRAEDSALPRMHSGSRLEKFATDIGIDAPLLEAAADPRETAPFIQLDHKYWEALKNTPGYGQTAPVALAATVLLLWGRHCDVGDVTSASIGKILKPLNLVTSNFARTIKRSDWLQLRGDVVKLDPSSINKAEELVRVYCNAKGKAA